MTLFQVARIQLFVQLKTMLSNHRQLALAITIISPAFVIAFPFICILISSQNQPDLARAVCFAVLISLQFGILNICMSHLKSPPNSQFLVLIMASKNRIARGLIPIAFLMCVPIWLPLLLLLWANIDDGAAHLSWLSTLYIWTTTLAICFVSCWSLRTTLIIAIIATLGFSSLIVDAHKLSIGIIVCISLSYFIQNKVTLKAFGKLVQSASKGTIGLIILQYLKQWLGWWLICLCLIPLSSWIVFEHLNDFQKFEWLLILLLIIYNLGFKRFNLMVADIQPQYMGMQSIFGIKKPASAHLISLLSIGIMLAMSVFLFIASEIKTGVQIESLIHFGLIILFSFVVTCQLLNKKWQHAIVAGHFIPVLLGVTYYLIWPSCCG
jgi:hypothetical protein